MSASLFDVVTHALTPVSAPRPRHAAPWYTQYFRRPMEDFGWVLSVQYRYRWSYDEREIELLKAWLCTDGEDLPVPLGTIRPSDQDMIVEEIAAELDELDRDNHRVGCRCSDCLADAGDAEFHFRRENQR